eukprot:7381710-Prymnesium_polylepis.2
MSVRGQKRSERLSVDSLALTPVQGCQISSRSRCIQTTTNSLCVAAWHAFGCRRLRVWSKISVVAYVARASAEGTVRTARALRAWLAWLRLRQLSGASFATAPAKTELDSIAWANGSAAEPGDGLGTQLECQTEIAVCGDGEHRVV